MLSSLPALTSQAFPSLLFAAKPRPRRRTTELWFAPPSFVGERETTKEKKKNRPSRLGFRSNDCSRKNGRDWSGFARRCRDWDIDESDYALESEILEFMRRSEKPDAFPSRKELVDGGRTDLVDAILKKRGWMSFGWNLDDDDEEEEEETVRGFNDYGGFEEASDWSSNEEKSQSSSMVSFCPYDADYSHPASSSGRSLETETTDNESGIEGILSRLEKERNLALGFDSGNIEDCSFSASNDVNNDWRSKFSTDGTVAGLFKSGKSSSLSPNKAVFDHSSRRLNHNHSPAEVDCLRNPPKPDTWRAWSIQRAGGTLDIDSKDLGKDGKQRTEITGDAGEKDGLGLQKHEEISHNQIRSRLQHLELELSTVLHSVRSNADEIVLQKNQESSSDEMQKLTDAWEFQQNEIMNAQDKLRSTRAKIAVLEGKMALALIDAQKIMEQKQERIDDARRALRLLRSTCIVWPNSASEVLLAGSFDGWASKRKMEKSRTGIFSLWLQLYPGKYEIKFIVDGEWRIDPLRPTVNNNGHENNLLMVT